MNRKAQIEATARSPENSVETAITSSGKVPPPLIHAESADSRTSDDSVVKFHTHEYMNHVDVASSLQCKASRHGLDKYSYSPGVEGKHTIFGFCLRDKMPISICASSLNVSDAHRPVCVTRQLLPLCKVETFPTVRSTETSTEQTPLRRSPSSSLLRLRQAEAEQGATHSEKESKRREKEPLKKTRRGPRSTTSHFVGVTFYRRTGRWESHIWDCGKQVYLGGFDTAHAAARAYDRAAIRFRGIEADINFSVTDYEEEMHQMNNLSKEETVHMIRRQSKGFSRRSSKYRGVSRHKCGRWEARMGQFLGKKAYDIKAIRFNGKEAVTNFDPGLYENEGIEDQNSTGSYQNLELGLGIVDPTDWRKEASPHEQPWRSSNTLEGKERKIGVMASAFSSSVEQHPGWMWKMHFNASNPPFPTKYSLGLSPEIVSSVSP